VFDDEAKERMTSGVNQHSPVEKLPQASKGKSRDKAGEAVEAVIRDDAECLAMFREAMKEQGKRTDLSDNVREVKPADSCGNSRAYSIARVQKSCDPELRRQALRGDLQGGD
jgi:hypothetical protein